MSGIVIGVGGVVVGFNEREPIPQRPFVRIESLSHAETRENCHSSPNQRSVREKRKSSWLGVPAEMCTYFYF